MSGRSTAIEVGPDAGMSSSPNSRVHSKHDLLVGSLANFSFVGVASWRETGVQEMISVKTSGG